MDMYLLLRNNKQSGPHTLEQLRSLGLKAYDLIWLEGKSAAWRYPGEIEELKEFAPPVEEQPFDRFYKRPVAASVTTVSSASPGSTLAPAAPVPAPTAPIYTGEPSAVPGKRIIYVTMPATRTSAPLRETPREPVHETPRDSIRPTADPIPPHSTPLIEDNSSHLPSLEAQLEALSPRPAKRRSMTTRLLRPLAIGAAVLALLAAGIFIGLALRSNKASLTPQETIALKDPVQNGAPRPVTNAVQPTRERSRDADPEIIDEASAMPPVLKATHTATPKQKPASQKKPAIPPPVTKDSFRSPLSSSQQSETIHRAEVVDIKPEPAIGKEAARTSIASQVSVGANSYIVGTFGGINDLQLTVTNRSVYPLDLVLVEVRYIQANKKVFKTENMYFRNIGAGAALMQEAPKSPRGIKVEYRIVTISSKELGLTYSGI